MVGRPYTPEAGDLVWLSFSPQAGRRPVLVLSPAEYNARTGLCVACPVTSHVKGYPAEVALPPGHSIAGVILSDHVRSVDWRARLATLISPVPAETLQGVRARLRPLIGV